MILLFRKKIYIVKPNHILLQTMMYISDVRKFYFHDKNSFNALFAYGNAQ